MTPWPFPNSISEEEVLELFPPFKVRPLILWSVGQHYLAINYSANLIADKFQAKIQHSQLTDTTIQWLSFRKDIPATTLQRICKAPVITL